MKNLKLASFFLRIGLASVFLYAAVAAFIEPTDWLGYLPPFLKSFFPAEQLLVIFSIYEIILGLWLLAGIKMFYSALLSTLTMAGIIFANFGLLDVVFRDIAIFFAGLALMAMSPSQLKE